MRKTNDKDDLIVYDPAPVIEAIDRLTKKHGTETGPLNCWESVSPTSATYALAADALDLPSYKPSG